MKLLKKILILGLVVLLNSGCSKDKYHADAILERDGKVYSLYPYELDENDKSNIGDALYKLNLEYKYKDSNIDVDNNIYNFIIVIPIKTKSDLKKIISDYYEEVIFNSYGQTGWFLSLTNIDNNDSYNHYKFYAASNSIASFYFLNDIKHRDVYINYKRNDFDNDIKITSNKLTIPAEEFEEMLERLAISHERLAFQPEGY